ncbi:MAG: membrane protein insertase YidC [Clostridia bacterium]|nr:membrane protein insertase YidC [Clostridia bacterium]
MNMMFSLFAKPLGWVMHWIYQLVPSYFLALLIFTFAIRLVLFPLSINNQKSQMDRARLAPRLERIQKKYAQDRQKMAQKQQELYEKEGVKMTGGCLPMILQMLVLFSVIAVIYKPLTYVQQVPAEQINTCISVAVEHMDPEKDKNVIKQMESENSYYREIHLLSALEKDAVREDMVQALWEKNSLKPAAAELLLDNIEKTGDEFSLFGISLLETPDIAKPRWVWIIAILSGVSAFLTSMLSMHYSKMTMSEEQKKMGGCSTNMMMYMMPVMSLVISFTVPAGVAVYWIFSNLLAMVQTVALNAMYSPAKARAQAEAEYQARRQKKREEREALKASRLAEQAAWQEEEKKAKARAKGDITQKKSAATPATPAELPEDKVNEIPEESVSNEEEA